MSLRTDANGNPYMLEPGDMGEWKMVPSGQVNAATGEPIMVRKMVRKPKYTGGFNADGSPTLAK